MSLATLITKFLFFSVLAGLIGTAGLTFFLSVLTRSGAVKAPMVVALGSLFTHSRKRAHEVGLFVHLFSGITFGVMYTWVLMAVGASSFGAIFLFGLLLGGVHGVFVAIFLVATVSDFHPLEEFRDAGFGVGLAHGVAHVIYGGLVGLIIGMSGLVQAL